MAISAGILGLWAEPAEARRKDNGVRCAVEYSDGYIEFFVVGENHYFAGEGWGRCESDGYWGDPPDYSGPVRGKGG